MENMILIILAAGLVMGILSLIIFKSSNNLMIALIPEALTLFGGIGFSLYAYFTAPSDAWVGLGLMIIGIMVAGIVALSLITFLIFDALFQ